MRYIFYIQISSTCSCLPTSLWSVTDVKIIGKIFPYWYFVEILWQKKNAVAEINEKFHIPVWKYRLIIIHHTKEGENAWILKKYFLSVKMCGKLSVISLSFFYCAYWIFLPLVFVWIWPQRTSFVRFSAGLWKLIFNFGWILVHRTGSQKLFVKPRLTYFFGFFLDRVESK